MGWKLRNKDSGFEIPLAAEPFVNQPCLAYDAWLPFDQAHHHFFMAEYDLVEDFEFPTKPMAVIQCESVTPGGKPGLFHRSPSGAWLTPNQTYYTQRYVRENFQNFKVLFEGVDES